MTFLAGLELSRRRLLFLRQAKPFAELWMYRREDGGESDETPDPNALVEKGAEA
jgi:chromatin segregation and condensation protein Rec8/ScpA/Scc1 (kleisin family)